MKNIYLILLLFSICFLEDRAYIFNTGAPESLDEGYTISPTQSVADRFMVANDYVLEALVFYATTISEEANLIISIREDNNGLPGNLVSELSSWNYNLQADNTSGYNLIVTTDLCIYLDTGNYYWFQIDAADESTEAIWIYSNASLYTYAISNDSSTWDSYIGFAGAGIIFAEQIFNPPYSAGDVNFDFIVNVRGGGLSGQAGALILGISRALIAFEPSHKSALKKEKLTTRDSRAVERKKYGHRKARRSFQFSKR